MREHPYFSRLECYRLTSLVDYANASLALGQTPFSISGHIGYYDLDNAFLFGDVSYIDWSVGIATAFEGVGLALTYGDTDLDDSLSYGDTSQVWFTISKAL